MKRALPPAVGFLCSLLWVGSAARVEAQVPAHLDPSRVLVIYDLNTPDANGNGVGDSQEVAEAYRDARGVPPQNLVALTCSPGGITYSGGSAWSQFVTEVRDPVVTALTSLGLANVDTLLFCHGVPYRLSLSGFGIRSLDQTMMVPTFLNPAFTPFVTYWTSSPYFEGSPGVGFDRGHFSHVISYGSSPFYLVSRLDGPNVQSCLELIEGARYGDRYIDPSPGHYHGNIYVDTRYSNYANVATLPFPQHHAPSYVNADQDLAWGTQWMFASGFPVRWENTSNSREIGETGALFHDGTSAETAPDALFYYGWYNYNLYRDVWTWLPGSVASDLNSNSIKDVHLAAPNTFLSSAMRRGLCAGAGAIAEPFLNGHPFPEVLIKYVLDGYSFAEAAAVSDPTQFWRSLYVGDPLYCPMRVGKVPELDVTAPPTPVMELASVGAGEATVRVDIDPSGTAPDLITVGGTFGPAPRLDQPIPHGVHYRLGHDVVLSGLQSGVFYRTALEVRDPVGNTTSVPEALVFDDGGAGLAATVQASELNPAAGTSVGIEYALRVPGGLANVTHLALTVDVPQAGIIGLDVLPVFVFLPLTLHGDPLAELVSLEVQIPSGLPSGTFVLHLDASTAQETVHASVTVAVP